MAKKIKNRNLWFTADLHLGHSNIIKYCNRPFSSVEEMDETLIERWNWLVKPKDVVYFLGDFCMGGREQALQYFNRLNGQIYVVPGGHDKRWARFQGSYTGLNCVVRILSSLYTITYGINKQVIVLCHYCMRVWDRSHYNSWQLHGHSHGGLLGVGKQMDVGVDTNDFYPYSLEDIERRMKELPDNFNLVKHK